MKIVIDILKEVYESAKNGTLNELQSMYICGSVVEGTPLPKGHGRLVDADSLLDHIVDYGEGQHRLMLIDTYYVRNADAIIEADKETENDDESEAKK